MKWWSRTRKEPGAPLEDDTPGPESQATDEAAVLNEAPAPGIGGRRRVTMLVVVLAISVSALWWVWGHSGSSTPRGLDTRTEPLLAVRRSEPLRPEPPRGIETTPASPEPKQEATAPPPEGAQAPGPTYYRSLPSRPGSSEGAPSVAARQLVEKAYEIALKTRETQLAALDAQKAEQVAKTREAEAKEAVAKAKIKAIERNPTSALGGAEGGVPMSQRPVPPMAVPLPPPGFPGPGPGSLVVPPKGVGSGPPAEIDPKPAEVFVRLTDTSTDVPEAMVTVGPASYVVRIGDPIGAWKVTGISPTGIWITASKQRAWRPVLAGTRPGAQGTVPEPGLGAAPTRGARLGVSQ